MISQVTIKISHNGESRDIWFLFESEHPDLAAFADDLADDGIIYGVRIESEGTSERGRRRETSRYECILSRDAIVSVIPSRYELISPEPVRA